MLVGRQRSAVGALTLAVVLTAAALGGCGQSRAPASSPGTLRWAPCRAGQGPPEVQCATLVVPLDTTPAAGAVALTTGRAGGVATGPVGLALDRIPARSTRLGSLVVNPGGPGVSAVDALPGIAGLLGSSVRDHFDLVGYDPPGVGHSTAVRCLGDADLGAYLHLDPAAPGAGGLDRAVAADRSFAAACAARSGALLAHVSTDDAARDLDLVRAAVGDSRLTYLGFSYGTLLGATYAEQHPDRVRALVLDGAVDPSLGPLPALAQQSASVDAQFAAFAANCRSSATCPWPHAEATPDGFLRLLARVRASPLPAGAARRAGPAELLYGSAEGLYSAASWPALASALAAAGRGDGVPITALFDQYVGNGPAGTDRHVLEAETAVNCVDAPAPQLSDLAAAVGAVMTTAPLFGPLDLTSEATCSVWPVPAVGSPHTITAAGAPPIVVVGTTGDPVTPYAWARHLAAQLSSGVLVTRVGDGHTGYGDSSCVRRAVDAYLVHLTVPPAGARCATP